MKHFSKSKLYSLGEPIGDSCTRIEGERLILGGGGGGGGESTSIQKVEPPEAVKPYLGPFMEQAMKLYATPYKSYTGQRVADFTPVQQQAMQATIDRATQGNAGLNAANADLAKTMSGSYLSPESNPYLQQNVNTALDQVQGRVNSMMRGTGGYGGSAHTETLAKALGETASGMYGQNYENERTNMMRGLALAPSVAQTDYSDLQALSNVGDVQQERNQNLLNNQYENFLAQQQYPYQQLDMLGNSIRATMGAGGTTTSTMNNNYQSNRLASGLGGAATGAGLASALGMSTPWGAGIGAVGGLLGLF